MFSLLFGVAWAGIQRTIFPNSDRHFGWAFAKPGACLPAAPTRWEFPTPMCPLPAHFGQGSGMFPSVSSDYYYLPMIWFTGEQEHPHPTTCRTTVCLGMPNLPSPLYYYWLFPLPMPLLFWRDRYYSVLLID